MLRCAACHMHSIENRSSVLGHQKDRYIAVAHRRESCRTIALIFPNSLSLVRDVGTTLDEDWDVKQIGLKIEGENFGAQS